MKPIIEGCQTYYPSGLGGQRVRRGARPRPPGLSGGGVAAHATRLVHAREWAGRVLPSSPAGVNRRQNRGLLQAAVTPRPLGARRAELRAVALAAAERRPRDAGQPLAPHCGGRAAAEGVQPEVRSTRRLFHRGSCAPALVSGALPRAARTARQRHLSTRSTPCPKAVPDLDDDGASSLLGHLPAWPTARLAHLHTYSPGQYSEDTARKPP